MPTATIAIDATIATAVMARRARGERSRFGFGSDTAPSGALSSGGLGSAVSGSEASLLLGFTASTPQSLYEMNAARRSRYRL